MKHNYKYYVGQVVYFEGTTPLTIKKRCGNFDTPHYWTEERERPFDESELLENLIDNRTEEEKAEDREKKRIEEQRESYLRELERLDDNCLALSKYARNLNKLALIGKLPMTYGRQTEINNIRTILMRRTKPNPLLIGQAGCGKTAIIEELARQFVNERLETGNPYTPVIYDLSLNALISGARYRGDFEERLQEILNILAKKEKIIIFIDEIHQLNSIGNNDGAVSAGQILKPALARGEIRCIGATTIDEYNKHITTDKALTRRFSIVQISTLTGELKKECVTNIVAEYGQYFGVNTDSISTDLLLDIIDNIIPETVFPDNVIDIVDETLAIAKFKGATEITDGDIKQTVSKQHNILIV